MRLSAAVFRIFSCVMLLNGVLGFSPELLAQNHSRLSTATTTTDNEATRQDPTEDSDPGTAAFSPADNLGGLRLGLRAAPFASYLLNSDDTGNDTLDFSRELTLGYTGGISIGQQLRPWFGFETGVYFARLGQQYDQRITSFDSTGTLVLDSSFTTELQVNYFQVPLLARFHFNPQNRLQVMLQAGIQLSILNQVTFFANDEEQPDTLSTEFLERRDLYTTAEVSGVLAIGLSYRISSDWSMDFALRGTYSLADIEDQNFKTPGRAPSRFLTAGVMLGVTYILPLRQRVYATEVPE